MKEGGDELRIGFQTTHWSVVAQAIDSNAAEFTAAMETLCASYWYPLYAFIRRNGYNPDDAQDLTQGFFEVLLAKRIHRVATPERGRFRTFLLAALKNYIANKRREEGRQKRGGGAVHIPIDFGNAEERYEVEPRDPVTPETIFDRDWALSVLQKVLAKLRGEYRELGLEARFEALNTALVDPDNAETYVEIARRLQMTETAVKSAASRLRRRFRELYRMEIAALVEDPLEIEHEIQHLMAALSS